MWGVKRQNEPEDFVERLKLNYTKTSWKDFYINFKHYRNLKCLNSVISKQNIFTLCAV